MHRVTRPYRQRLRAEHAAETRERILEAVAKRLREAPAERVSVDRVARDAGVARSTVYLVFGSRAGLFEAFGRYVVERQPYARLLEAVREHDPRVTLREGFHATVEMYEESRELYRTLWAMAQLDPEAFAGTVGRSDEERTEGMARLARRLHGAGALREGVGRKRAADLCWLLTSFRAYDELRSRGLPPDRVAELLIETAERTLLSDPARARRSARSPRA